MGRITRDMVLAGTELRHTVDTPHLGEDATMVIKPITDGQFMAIQALMFGDVTMSDRDAEPFKDKTMIEIAETEKETRRMAVAFALTIDGEEWTPEDVSLLPPGTVDKLYSEVALISGFPAGPRLPPEPSEDSEEEEKSEEPEPQKTT